ncbi:MAG: DUF551 domain-containing protein [Oleispira sp.]
MKIDNETPLSHEGKLKKLKEFVDNSMFIGDSSHDIADMCLTMMEHWSKSKWISVQESYPNNESGYRVLVVANDIVGQWTEIINYDGERWMQNGSEYPPIVTHWMPIPKEPK